MSDATSKSPSRVFISYSHDSPQHVERVKVLAGWLRDEGINSRIDLLDPVPEMGWPHWMETEFSEADFVLMVCTEIWLRRYEGKEAADKGHGVGWEAHLLRNLIYRTKYNKKVIPVLFNEDTFDYIPLSFQGSTYFRLPTEFGRLVQHLWGKLALRLNPVNLQALPLAPAPDPGPGWQSPWSGDDRVAPDTASPEHRVLTLRLVPHDDGLELVDARLYWRPRVCAARAPSTPGVESLGAPKKPFVVRLEDLNRLALRVQKYAAEVQNHRQVASAAELVIRFEVVDRHALVGFHRASTEALGTIGTAFRAVTVWPYRWDEDDEDEYAYAGVPGFTVVSRPSGAGESSAIATYAGPCSPDAAALRDCRAARQVFVSGASGWKELTPQPSAPPALTTHLDCALTVLLDCDDLSPFLDEVFQTGSSEGCTVLDFFAVARNRIKVGQDIHLIWTDTDYWHEDEQSLTALGAC